MTESFGPYTPIRKAGSFAFVSGQVGINAITKTAAANIGDQTMQALSNLLDVLKTEGLTLVDVVKVTVFLTNMDNFAAMNQVYQEQFLPPRPARSAVAVKELPRVADTELLVEIEAVAVYP
jgi:2-iminobutanoate/2-iminopropanoate deaminase